MRMSEVAERMGTTASTASGVVDGLVQRGLVDRVEDPADRRQVLVRATAAAQEQLEHVH
jgi:DNA-binding MarR family transcriptional regulator